MSTKEEWRTIAAYPLYEVSNFGRVRNATTKKLRVLFVNEHAGCVQCTVQIGGSRSSNLKVHTAVAAAFIGPRPFGKVIDHIDGDYRNNVVDNLRYVTVRENTQNHQGRRFLANICPTDSGRKRTAYNVQLRRSTSDPAHLLSPLLIHTFRACLHDAIALRDATCVEHGLRIPDKLEDYPDVKCECRKCSPLAQAS